MLVRSMLQQNCQWRQLQNKVREQCLEPAGLQAARQRLVVILLDYSTGGTIVPTDKGGSAPPAVCKDRVCAGRPGSVCPALLIDTKYGATGWPAM